MNSSAYRKTFHCRIEWSGVCDISHSCDRYRTFWSGIVTAGMMKWDNEFWDSDIAWEDEMRYKWGMKMWRIFGCWQAAEPSWQTEIVGIAQEHFYDIITLKYITPSYNALVKSHLFDFRSLESSIEVFTTSAKTSDIKINTQMYMWFISK